MDDYFVTFGPPGTDTYIGNSRAIQCKGLGIDDGFFTDFEGMQFQSTIRRQMVGICLIESYAPISKCAKIKEAARHTFKCLRCAYRVTKHDCDIALQSIVYQSLFTRC